MCQSGLHTVSQTGKEGHVKRQQSILTCDCEDKIYEVRSISERPAANNFQSKGRSSPQNQRLVPEPIRVEVLSPMQESILLDQEVDVLDGEDAGIQWKNSRRSASIAAPFW